MTHIRERIAPVDGAQGADPRHQVPPRRLGRTAPPLTSVARVVAETDPTANLGAAPLEPNGTAARRHVVTLRRRRDVHVAIAELDELPMAVGFESLHAPRPSRLRAVPLPRELSGLSTVAYAIPMPVPMPGALECVQPLASAPQVWRPQPALEVVPKLAVRTTSAPISEPAALRLTARGRAVLLIVAVAIGCAVVVSAWFGAGASRAATPSVVPARVVVHSGDTLWSIAGRIAPNRDPRAVVDQLLRTNHLGTPALVPGQVLRTR